MDSKKERTKRPARSAYWLESDRLWAGRKAPGQLQCGANKGKKLILLEQSALEFHTRLPQVTER